MSELDKGLVTSLLTAVCLMVFGFFTGEAITRTQVIGFAGALAGLIVWYYNEKHNSDLVSGNDEVETVVVTDSLETEEDLVNPEYDDCSSSDEEGC